MQGGKEGEGERICEPCSPLTECEMAARDGGLSLGEDPGVLELELARNELKELRQACPTLSPTPIRVVRFSRYPPITVSLITF